MDGKWLKLKDKYFLKERETRSDSTKYPVFTFAWVLSMVTVTVALGTKYPVLRLLYRHIIVV